MKTIEHVKEFWERSPLWEGESRFPTGSREFFEEHQSVCVADCFAGRMDERLFPPVPEEQRVLDLGCGIGFWTVEFGRRGYRNLTAADLTVRAVELTRERCALYGIEATVCQENAEHLDFEDGSFTHVNCQGVIHHTPQPARAVGEIARVLAPGGTASISVYYRNAALRLWPLLQPLGSFASLRGRGREQMGGLRDVDEIVRTYDGRDNPIGVAFTRSEFSILLAPQFEIIETFLHFFPARAISVKVPQTLHRVLDRRLGFMLYANVRKRA